MTTEADNSPVVIPAPTEITPKAFHAIMDANDCDLAKLQDVNNIIAWLENLTTIIGASDSDASATFNAHGMTGTKVFKQGSADVQCVTTDRQVYVDVFSFAEFDPQATEESIKTFFGAANVNKILLPRNAAVSV